MIKGVVLSWNATIGKLEEISNSYRSQLMWLKNFSVLAPPVGKF